MVMVVVVVVLAAADVLIGYMASKVSPMPFFLLNSSRLPGTKYQLQGERARHLPEAHYALFTAARLLTTEVNPPERYHKV